MKFKTFFALVSLLCLVSCSGKKIEKEIPREEKICDFEPVTEIREDRPDVYAVLKVMSSDYWQDIIDGITDSGSDNDCNVYIGGVKAENYYDIQEEMIHEACERGADAIILAPTDSSKFVGVSQMLSEKNIPLMLVDTTLTSTGYNTCFMTDNFQAGELAAEELIKVLSQKYTEEDNIQVAIQTTTKNSQTIVDRIAGFNKYWVKNTPENWTVIDEIKFNEGDIDIATQNGKDFLDEYDNIKVMVACNNSSSVGFANAIMERGENDIILSAFDYSDVVAEMIKSDDWTALTIVQRQYNMGYDAVKAAVDIINGAEPEYKFVDMGVMAINEGNYKEYEEKK